MGADLGVPLSDLRPLCVSVAGGESRKTFTQFSKRENVKTIMSGEPQYTFHGEPGFAEPFPTMIQEYPSTPSH